MRILIVSSFLLLSFLSSCVTDTKKTELTQPANTSTIKKSEIDKTNKLYAYFTDNPQTQDQKDENALIDYAIDKGLDVTRTASGMYYVLEKEGTGTVLMQSQPFKAHYSGYFMDGKTFDSSLDRGEPIAATVGAMIPGWNEALKTFKVGSKMTLLIPSRLAYGSRGFPGFVPPNTPLIFDLEILPLI